MNEKEWVELYNRVDALTRKYTRHENRQLELSIEAYDRLAFVRNEKLKTEGREETFDEAKETVEKEIFNAYRRKNRKDGGQEPLTMGDNDWMADENAAHNTTGCWKTPSHLDPDNP